MALKVSGLRIELREILLADFPVQALQASTKQMDDITVPILQLDNNIVIEESWDIVKWATQQNDPENWLGKNGKHLNQTEILVESNDFSFKPNLDRYKYADRYPDFPQAHYRAACEEFISELEERLGVTRYLLGDDKSVADIALFPFIRQFSMVDTNWFQQSEYYAVQRWLEQLIATPLFQHIFRKLPVWTVGATPMYV